MKTVKSTKGNDILVFSLEEIQNADENMFGFCLGCGSENSEVEPDARKYECESCGEKRVYGAQEVLLMGRAY